MHKAGVLQNGTGPVKPALTRGELSEREIEQLMIVFTRGKTEVLEDDAIRLLEWANRARQEAMLVDMVLCGAIVPSVKEGKIYVRLPDHGTGKNN